MHIIQQNILDHLETINSESLSLRKKAEIVGADHPQKLKHHIEQLEKKGLVCIDTENGVISRSGASSSKEVSWVRIPLYGQANAGHAKSFTHDHPLSHITISPSLLRKEVLYNVVSIYALEASGSSMNDASMPGADEESHISLKSGDYVLVNYKEKSPKDNDFVVSIINGVANIKRFKKDTLNKRVILFSDSKESMEPIIASEKDSYVVAGKVVQVIPRLGLT